MLVDTGAGASDAARFVQRILTKKGNPPLVVVHTHGHGEHVQGDKGFDGMAKVTMVAAAAPAVQKAFGIDTWPTQIGSIDLGDRVIDVIPIPGHQPAHVAYYDRKTAVLLTGDHLYPGRLSVTDFPEYLASTAAWYSSPKASRSRTC
jgi:glyoxylase-like metal-dependent hydrolase (beta-lactamase superfamily II)